MDLQIPQSVRSVANIKTCGRPQTSKNAGSKGLYGVYGKDKSKIQKSDEKEKDPHRLAQRQKQIDLGKSTTSYQIYRKLVPVRKRGHPFKHPRTPDKFAKVSKRAFDGRINTWKRTLHDFQRGVEKSNVLTPNEDVPQPQPPQVQLKMEEESKECLASVSCVQRSSDEDVKEDVEHDAKESRPQRPNLPTSECKRRKHISASNKNSTRKPTTKRPHLDGDLPHGSNKRLNRTPPNEYNPASSHRRTFNKPESHHHRNSRKHVNHNASSNRTAAHRNPASNTRVRDWQVRDSKVRDSKVRDSKVRDSQVRDSKGRDWQVRDSKVRDSKVRDSKVRDSQVRDSQVRDSEVRDSKVRDSQVRDSQDDSRRRHNPRHYTNRSQHARSRHSSDRAPQYRQSRTHKPSNSSPKSSYSVWTRRVDRGDNLRKQNGAATIAARPVPNLLSENEGLRAPPLGPSTSYEPRSAPSASGSDNLGNLHGSDTPIDYHAFCEAMDTSSDVRSNELSGSDTESEEMLYMEDVM